MKNLIVRTLSGLVYIGLLIVMIFFGGTYGFPLLMAIVFALLASGELFGMTEAKGGYDLIMFYDRVAVFIIAAMPLVSLLWGTNTCVTTAILLLLLRGVMQLYAHDHAPSTRMAVSLLAYIYIGATLAIASTLYLNYGSALVFTMFAMIWLNDTGAYLVGSAIGRRRLFERISPKKSWEGFFGGLLFAIGTGAAISLWIPALQTGLSTAQMCLLGLVVSIAATYGDLFESLLKRAAGVKDSGHIMPGHGGILDRIDSLLFVAPATLALLLIIL